MITEIINYEKLFSLVLNELYPDLFIIKRYGSYNAVFYKYEFFFRKELFSFAYKSLGYTFYTNNRGYAEMIENIIKEPIFNNQPVTINLTDQESFKVEQLRSKTN